jgi:diaminopimelate epimerase
MTTQIPFLKMHGAGNDFVVIDNRADDIRIDSDAAAKIAQRRFGIGCDQLVVMDKAEQADVKMRIYNADGGEVAACGNATRCIGWRVMQESGKEVVTIETQAGRLSVQRGAAPFQVTVDMGEPCWDWQKIPLTESRNTEHLGISDGALMDPVALSVGNPHMVFFVRDIDFVAMDKHGPVLEKNSLFPKGANVSAAQIIDSETIKLKVWERGAGLTLACGTAACATLVAAVRRKLTGRKATIQLAGGDLYIEWRETDNRILMTGPVAEVFSGTFERELIA